MPTTTTTFFLLTTYGGAPEQRRFDTEAARDFYIEENAEELDDPALDVVAMDIDIQDGVLLAVDFYNLAVPGRE